MGARWAKAFAALLIGLVAAPLLVTFIFVVAPSVPTWVPFVALAGPATVLFLVGLPRFRPLLVGFLIGLVLHALLLLWLFGQFEKTANM